MRCFYIKRVVWFSFVMSFLGGGSHYLSAQAIGGGKYTFSRLDLKHREHKGMGYDQGYSTASLFVCPRSGKIGFPFLDARLHVFNNSDLASNIGMGVRFSDIKESYLFGLNVYYDYRNTHELITQQASCGLEILSRRVDIRLNGYYPFSGKYQDDPILFSRFRGHHLLVQQKVRYALPCADAELGLTLPDPFDQIGLYVGLGYYYLFKQRGFNQTVGNVPGGRGRLTASPTEYISFGVEYTYDKLFGSRASGFVALNIPLGANQSKSSHSKTARGVSPITWVGVQTQDVVRNEIIPVLRKNHQFPHLNTRGNPLHFLFVDNTTLTREGVGKGEGTFEDPYTTLALASAKASSGDVVYVFFGEGTSRGYDEGFKLKADQILTSSGVDLELNGIVIPSLTPGNLPLITNHEGVVVDASFAHRVMVNGFRIQGDIDDALRVEGTEAIVTNNQVIAEKGYSALKSVGAIGHSRIINNDFYGHGGDFAVVELEGAWGVYDVHRNAIHAQDGQDGIHICNPHHTTSITHNTISSADPCGTALHYTMEQDVLINQGVQQCSYNNVQEGFYQAVHIEWDSPHVSTFTLKQNTFSSETLGIGISYESASCEGVLSIIDNTLCSSQGIKVRDTEAASTHARIAGNTVFCRSGSPSVAFNVLGSSDIEIENNRMDYIDNLSGLFSAISCEFASEESQGNKAFVSKNRVDMKSDNLGIFLINRGGSEAYMKIEENQILAKTKGIEIVNESFNVLHLDMIGNKEVSGFTLTNKGSGFFEIERSQEEMKQNNNPDGAYIFKDIKFALGE